MNKLLLKCNKNLISMPCCHSDRRECYCYTCLHEDFYNMPDKYDCEKKMNYYVLNYGPSYASEIYHYLFNSRILEGFNHQRKLKILSLGCGFGPDLMAINRYIDDENLPIFFEYCGIDESACWDKTRHYSNNVTFVKNNVIFSMNLNGYDLVFIVKLFSTLFKHKVHDQFLKVFSNAVRTQLRNDSIVVFNDINSVHMGRDVFHDSVKTLFRTNRQFYCDDPPYTGSGWTKIKIPGSEIVFSIPRELSVNPLMEIRNTVFFEYRK
jgi:hypothetical protein